MAAYFRSPTEINTPAHGLMREAEARLLTFAWDLELKLHRKESNLELVNVETHPAAYMACFIGVMAGNDKVATQLLTVCSKLSRWSSSSTDMIFCSKILLPKRSVSVSTVEDYAKNILRFWTTDFVGFVATVVLQRMAWHGVVLKSVPHLYFPSCY